jgi:predicted ATPase/DNA-binding winged helix-turn-helix (wHTH) protein
MDNRPPAPPATLRFGGVELRPAERVLLVDGQPAALGARAFDLLLALAERPGRLVSKPELIDLVWPGVVVEENNLQVQVSALRKLLGPQAIATIPGRGYRFTLVAASTDDEPAAAGAPAAPAPAALPPGNLIEPPPIVGRAADEQAAATLIAPRTLLTLVGAGGIGKTRLAQALAWQQRRAWRDGVWWIELAALSDATRVVPTVAAALGASLPGDGAAGPTELAQQLAPRSALIVFDNCEHLVDAVSAVAAALLAHAPGIALLATSQELLKLGDERVYRLEPLALPPTAHDDPLAYGAVALFVQRVRALQPAFALTPAQAPTVVEICRRLDGLPLAIELAAARVPLLGLDGLRQHLNARFRLLTGGTRMALRKHQTLRAALEWSHGLLDDDERTVFRRLGVFAGGFTLELAQLVAADERRDGWAVLELLSHLVDKSLVVASAGASDSVPRYSLLETTRAFALEQLGAAGEAEALLRRHALVMCDFAQTIGQRRWTLTVPQAMAAQRELDNLRAALDWATGDGGDRTLAIDLLGGGAIIWFRAGLLDEGLDRMLALLPLPADVGARREADFCLGIARLGFEVGRRAEYWQAAQRAEELYRQLGDEDAVADALIPLSTLAAWRGEVDAAQRALDEAQGLIGDDAPMLKRASLAVARASFANWRGDHETALAAFKLQFALYRDARFGGESLARSNIGQTLLFAGRVDAAIETLTESIDAQRRAEPWVHIGLGVGALAVAYALRGDAQALAVARDAYAQQRPRGTTETALIAAALHHAAQGDTARALLIAGWIYAEIERQQWRLYPPVRAWRQRVLELAASALPQREVERWLGRCKPLREKEVAALAFDDAPLPPD